MKLLNAGPSTDEEIKETDEFLLGVEGIDEAMDLSTLDGLLAAILCGPRPSCPANGSRWVWDMERGDDSPVFADQARRSACSVC